MRISWRLAPLVFVLLGAALPVRGVESGPQGVVRQFCEADALGRRVSVHGWRDVAPLVEWSFEPAWDQVVLISGYQIESPRSTDSDALAVDVKYDVIGHVSAFGLETGVHVETVTFRVHAPNNAWRLIAPLPPPHVFANRVDVDPMRRSFEYGSADFIPDSLFIWRMYRGAGWSVPFESVTDLLRSKAYGSVDKPVPGDVVVYSWNGLPYHAGLLEAPGRVVSATLNAGIVRSPIDAFAGDVTYLRLVQPDSPPTGRVRRKTPPAVVRGAPPPPVRRVPSPGPPRATPVARPLDP